MRISGSGGPQVPPEEAVRVIPAGTPEAAVIAATLQLEESAQSGRDSQRTARRTRSVQRRKAIAERRHASRLQLAGTLVQSTAQAAAGAIAIGNASQQLAGGPTTAAQRTTSEQQTARANGRSQGTAAGGTAIKAATDFAASEASERAAGRDLAAETAADVAGTSEDAAESAERFADKAQGHLDAIARAKHEAAMAALRG